MVLIMAANTPKNSDWVLLIDPNPDVQLALTDLLEAQGYRIRCVPTGEEALRAIEQGGPFATALLDLALPDMEGIDLLKRLPIYDPHLPIIVITGQVEIDREIRAFHHGVLAFVRKPYHGEQVLALLRRAVEVRNLNVHILEVKQELKYTEEQFRLTIDHIKDGVFHLDSAGKIGWANRQAASLLERPYYMTIGHPFSHCFDPHVAETVDIWLNTIRVDSLAHDTNEFRIKGSNGTEKWVEITASNIVRNGTVNGQILIGRDVTTRKQQEALLETIYQAQTQFLGRTHPSEMFDNLLQNLLTLTQSQYGFLGEVLHTKDGQAYLKTQAISNVAWNQETRQLFERSAPNLEFFNLQTLFGSVITTGKPVVSNDPFNDPRAGGVPKGHPSLDAFLGLPFHYGERLVGMAGIANRPGGYDEDVIAYLQPLLISCGTLIEAFRNQGPQSMQEPPSSP